MKKNTFTIYAILSIIVIIILTIFSVVFYREKHESECNINYEIEVDYNGSDVYNPESFYRTFSFGSDNKCDAYSYIDGTTIITFSGEWDYRVRNLKEDLPNILIWDNNNENYTYNVYYNGELIKTNYVEGGTYEEYEIKRVGKNQPLAYGKIETGDIEFVVEGEGTYIIELIFNVKVNGNNFVYKDQKEITFTYLEKRN